MAKLFKLMDMLVIGTKNEELADYLRALAEVSKLLTDLFSLFYFLRAFLEVDLMNELGMFSIKDDWLLIVW